MLQCSGAFPFVKDCYQLVNTAFTYINKNPGLQNADRDVVFILFWYSLLFSWLDQLYGLGPSIGQALQHDEVGAFRQGPGVEAQLTLADALRQVIQLFLEQYPPGDVYQYYQQFAHWFGQLQAQRDLIHEWIGEGRYLGIPGERCGRCGC